ncbi:MAG: hypothetical protein V1729_06955 [Candidatus Woesearchaeota archaeon]
MGKDDVTEKLIEIYHNAEKDGIWIKEFGSGPGSDVYMAAAGSIKRVEELEKKIGQEIDISKLELGDVVNMSLPGTGSSREEACTNAILAFKEYVKGTDEKYSLYSSFDERGYHVEAYTPNDDSVPQEFVVKAYKDDKLVEEMKVPMLHRPVFGVDVGDIAELEAKTEELMKKLP